MSPIWEASKIKLFGVKAVTVYCPELSVPFVLSLASQEPLLKSQELSKNLFIVKEIRKKTDLFSPFTVGTPTTAAQPPFQPQYVSDYVFFTSIHASHIKCCEFTSELTRLHALLYMHVCETSCCVCLCMKTSWDRHMYVWNDQSQRKCCLSIHLKILESHGTIDY